MGIRERTVHWVEDPYARPLVSLCGHAHMGIRKVKGSYVRHVATRVPGEVTCSGCMDVNPLLELAGTDI